RDSRTMVDLRGIRSKTSIPCPITFPQARITLSIPSPRGRGEKYTSGTRHRRRPVRPLFSRPHAGAEPQAQEGLLPPAHLHRRRPLLSPSLASHFATPLALARWPLEVAASDSTRAGRRFVFFFSLLDHAPTMDRHFERASADLFPHLLAFMEELWRFLPRRSRGKPLSISRLSQSSCLYSTSSTSPTSSIGTSSRIRRRSIRTALCSASCWRLDCIIPPP